MRPSGGSSVPSRCSSGSAWSVTRPGAPPTRTPRPPPDHAGVVGEESGVRRALPELLGGSALAFGLGAALTGRPARAGRATVRPGRSKCLVEQRRGADEGGLAVPELRAVLGRGDRQHVV